MVYFVPRRGFLVRAAVVGVANPIMSVRGKCEGRHNLHAVAAEVDDNNLPVAAQVGLVVSDSEPTLHFLQQRGLPRPDVSLKAVVDRDGQQEIHVHVARWPNGGVLCP